MRVRLQVRRRARTSPPPPAVPPLQCPHCRALLPERAGEYALFAYDAGRIVRASADLSAGSVHIDVGTAISEPHRVATIDQAGTGAATIRIWSDYQCGLSLRRRIPALARHAWQRALDREATRGSRAAWQERRPHPAPEAEPEPNDQTGDGDRHWPGRVLADTGAGPARGTDPKLDAALAAINAELDTWVAKFGGETAPAFARDPVTLWAAIAGPLRAEFEHRPDYALALSAGAMVRAIRPPDRHDLPADPFDESRT